MAAFEALDHAILSVPDLSAAEACWRSFGFRLTPLGRHATGGTANHCIMFGQAYIEIAGQVDAGAPPTPFGAAIKAKSGGIGFALTLGDPDAAKAALAAGGIEASGPYALERPLTLDGVTETVRFSNLTFDAGLPGTLAFACAHLTPHLTRARHEWELHPNGATGLRELIIASDDPAHFRKSLVALFGSGRVAGAPHGISAILSNTALGVMNSVGLKERFGTKALDGLPEGDGLAALSICVNEPDAAASMLDAARVPYMETRHGLIVPAKATGGVVLEMVEG
jgi:hypothetical protein